MPIKHVWVVLVILSYDFGALADYSFLCEPSWIPPLSTVYGVKQDAENAKWILCPVRDQIISFGIEYPAPLGLDLELRGRFAGTKVEQNWYHLYENKEKVGERL